MGLVRVGGVWGLAALRRALWAAQMSWGRLRIRCRAVVKVFCHGQLSGRRSLWRPLWLTRRPGTVRSRLAMVAATVSWRVGWARPRRAVQRARLCASTQQASQAPLAGNRPEGQWVSPRIVETSSMRRRYVTHTTQVRPGVQSRCCADRPGDAKAGR